jgi:hypothetical protein
LIRLAWLDFKLATFISPLAPELPELVIQRNEIAKESK